MHRQTSMYLLEVLWEATTNVQMQKSIFKSITTPYKFRWFTASFSFWMLIWTWINSWLHWLLWCQRGFNLSCRHGLKARLPGGVWTLVWRSGCPTNHSLAGWTAPCNEDTLKLISLSSFAYSFTKQTNKCQRLNMAGASLAWAMATQEATRAPNDELRRQPLKQK